MLWISVELDVSYFFLNFQGVVVLVLVDQRTPRSHHNREIWCQTQVGVGSKLEKIGFDTEFQLKLVLSWRKTQV